MSIPPRQLSFNLDARGTGEDGLDAWRVQRWKSMRELARKMGLPLERRVEVWLCGEIRLCGVLRLREAILFVPEEVDPQLELEVDNVPFKPAEMVSCVALD